MEDQGVTKTSPGLGACNFRCCIILKPVEGGYRRTQRGSYSPKEGVFAEKGARFRGKWGLAPPAPPPPRPLAPAPPPFLLGGSGGFTENPGGGGVFQEGGGRRGPIYRENEPPFRRKRLKGVFLPSMTFESLPSENPFQEPF